MKAPDLFFDGKVQLAKPTRTFGFLLLLGCTFASMVFCDTVAVEATRSGFILWGILLVHANIFPPRRCWRR